MGIGNLGNLQTTNDARGITTTCSEFSYDGANRLTGARDSGGYAGRGSQWGLSTDLEQKFTHFSLANTVAA